LSFGQIPPKAVAVSHAGSDGLQYTMGFALRQTTSVKPQLAYGRL